MEVVSVRGAHSDSWSKEKQPVKHDSFEIRVFSSFEISGMRLNIIRCR